MRSFVGHFEGLRTPPVSNRVNNKILTRGVIFHIALQIMLEVFSWKTTKSSGIPDRRLLIFDELAIKVVLGLEIILILSNPPYFTALEKKQLLNESCNLPASIVLIIILRK